MHAFANYVCKTVHFVRLYGGNNAPNANFLDVEQDVLVKQRILRSCRCIAKFSSGKGVAVFSFNSSSYYILLIMKRAIKIILTVIIQTWFLV